MGFITLPPSPTHVFQGATVKCSKKGKVLISRVLHGGAADKSGE